MVSQNGSILLAKAIGSITDPSGNSWTIENGRVVVNGYTDYTTARVTSLVLSGGKVWQENADGKWWANTGDGWNPPYGTKHAPTPDRIPGTNVVTLSSDDAPLVDTAGNQWRIHNGQVVINDVVDQSTRNVTELAYVDGKVWQQNQDTLWWAKSSPTDGWNPPYGAVDSPVAGEVRTWVGTDGRFAPGANWTAAGPPQSGDTAVINAGVVSVEQGYGSGVSFTLGGPSAFLDFEHQGYYNIGTLSGSGEVDASRGTYPGSVTVSAQGVSLSANDNLVLQDYQTMGNFVLRGDSYLGQSSSLTVGVVGTNHVPFDVIQNGGKMTLDHASMSATVVGNGSVSLTNGSQMSTDFQTSEIISLESGHLDLGGWFSAGESKVFQGSISNFGDDSSISVNDAQGMSAIVKTYSPTVHEMLLMGPGNTTVADIRFVGGAADLYASNDTTTPGGSILISAHDTGHSFPMFNA